MADIPMLNDTPDGEAYLNMQITALKAGNAALRIEIDRLQTKAAVAVDHARDLERALADRSGAVKVKELEWTGNLHGTTQWAETPFGSYAIDPTRARPMRFMWSGITGDWATVETGAEAKAAAQADYERRIRSALTTGPANDHIADAGKMVEPAAPDEQQEADETVSAYDFMAQEFDRLAILRKMWGADEVAATIRRMAIPSQTEFRPAEQAVTEALRSHWHGVFLDGRNEHGSHVIRLPQRSIELEQDEAGNFLKELAETILSDAEALGFSVGDAVAITFDLCTDDGFFSHYEYVGVSEALTSMLYGSSAEQAAALARKEGRP